MHSRKAIQDSLTKMREKQMRESGMNTILDPESNRKYLSFVKRGTRETIDKDVDEVNTLSNTIMSKINKIMKEQNDDKFLSRVSLPRLPPAWHPVISRIDVGRATFVAENDAHSKNSNFGYNRNKFGGFFNH